MIKAVVKYRKTEVFETVIKTKQKIESTQLTTQKLKNLILFSLFVVMIEIS